MIHIRMPYLPPSDNQAYFNAPSRKKKVGGMSRGGRVLTQAGKAYKEKVTNHVVKEHATQVKELEANCTVGAFIGYGFPDLLTKGYPKDAKFRYTRQDLLNRAKLLMDGIVEATPVDDSQICIAFLYKYQSEKPETQVWLWNEDMKNVGAQLVTRFAEVAGLIA